MFVCIVANGYPSKRYLGNGIFALDQAKALSAAGCNVVLAAVDLRSLRRWRKWGVEHFVKDSVEIYAINIPLGRVPHMLLRMVGQWGIKILYQHIKNDHGEPDIIHAHFIEMAEIAMVLRSVSKARFIATEHSSLLLEASPPLWVLRRARYIYEANDLVIAVSQALACKMKFDYDVNAVVVPNVVDSLFFDGDNEEPQKLSDTFVFVSVIALYQEKHPLECILAFYQAFHNLNDRFTIQVQQQERSQAIQRNQQAGG